MTLAVAAFLSALVGSPHCVGMCGPFALACGQSVSESALWHAGRITTYVALGSLAGAFGSILLAPLWIATAVSALLVIWFSGVLAGIVPEPRWTPTWLGRTATRWLAPNAQGTEDPGARSTYLFGLANGLLPCGLVYAALGLAVATTGVASGAFVMFAFGLGTVPTLAVLMFGGRRLAIRTLRGRRVLALLVLITGLGSIALRGGLLGPH